MCWDLASLGALAGSVQVKSKLPFGPSCQILPPKRAPLEPALVEPVSFRQGSARDIQRAPTKALQARKAADRQAAGLARSRRADSGSGGGAACAGTGMRAPLHLKLYVCHQSQRLENPLNAPLPLPFVPELRTTMRKLFALACVAALMGCAAGMRQLSESYDYSSTSPHCPPRVRVVVPLLGVGLLRQGPVLCCGRCGPHRVRKGEVDKRGECTALRERGSMLALHRDLNQGLCIPTTAKWVMFLACSL